MNGTDPNNSPVLVVGGAATAAAVAAVLVAAFALLTPEDATAARDAIGVQDAPRLIPLFGYATVADATPVVQALAGFTPADYAITARTTTLTLDAIGSVTSGSQTGTLEILDAADVTVASIDWTETTPTRKTDVITLPGSAEIYRARISCAGVVDPLTDYALIGGAVLRITWS